MSASVATSLSTVKVPVVDRKTRWVIIQVNDDGTLFVEPGSLQLDQGWVGDIVWYVFTDGYKLADGNGIVFPEGSQFDGEPMPDPSRPGCWSCAASNDNDTKNLWQLSYTITVLNEADGTMLSGDPVIENEPVP